MLASITLTPSWLSPLQANALNPIDFRRELA
jgi:hypothetical protein